MGNIHSKITVRDVREIALAFLERSLRNPDAATAKGTVREPVALMRFQTEEEIADRIRKLGEHLRDETPIPWKEKLAGLNRLVQDILDSNTMDSAEQRLREVQEFLNRQFSVVFSILDQGYFFQRKIKEQIELFRTEHPPDTRIESRIESGIEDLKFVAAAMQMCAEYRRRNIAAREIVTLTVTDDLALARAYQLLDRGVHLPRWIEPLRKSAERPHQTYLSFADPGNGHLKVTVRDSTLLDGTIVHIEWIDRDNVDRKDLVEAYRLPALRSAARVRLHVGATTPCTAFIGRPVFETRVPGKGVDGRQFEMDLLKSAHMTASACSSMFAHGVVDCKVAMDGMTAQQAVDFMRAVAGNVARDPGIQWLSGAFNINTHIIDDRHGELGRREISKPFEIAQLGIELVKQGKFDKIAWDGASDKQPSEPIIGQLTRPELLELVHAAHQRGLETYISAGMVSKHMKDAAYIGVGGVGIGTSLHYVADNRIGEIDPDRVRKALNIRNEAAEDDAGQAAKMLAVLDWQWSEGSLTFPLAALRDDLYQELLKFNQELERKERSLAANKPDEKEPAAPELSPEEKDKLREELRSFGKNVQVIRGILDDIKRKQEVLTPRSATLTIQDSGDRIPPEISDHPLFQRAERAVRAYESNQGVVGPVTLDRLTVEKLKGFLKHGDLDGIERLYSEPGESVSEILEQFFSKRDEAVT